MLTKGLRYLERSGDGVVTLTLLRVKGHGGMRARSTGAGNAFPNLLNFIKQQYY